MEKPILFKKDMVKAILDGSKTQTRRLNGLKEINKDPDNHILLRLCNFNGFLYAQFTHLYNLKNYYIKSPFGKSGDIMWVRENWWKPPIVTNKMLRDGADTWPKIDYDATIYENDRDFYLEHGWKRKSSLFMSRKQSRIDNMITDVRVQRVQDISESDALAEGIHEFFRCNPIGGFKNLWDSINDKRGYGWNKNPWVLAYTFERVKP